MSNIEERLSKVNANDRRVKRTKKLLRDSLFTLLQEKSINEITVTELTEIADINRATFYFYYTDIMDMLDQIQNEAYELFEDVLVGTEDHIDSMEDFAKYIENILIFCKENPTIARFVITREYNNNKVLKKIKKLLAKKVPVAKENYSQDDPRRFVLNFALNALTGTVVDWMDDGMIIPPPIMAEFIANMYISGSLHAKQKFQSYDKEDDE
ncbi:MAG: TetR/AcrR family transcriptional regulator [Clostridia bacterium]|nr:TetR/AcrR family transcriptional regulator [Oscillospiraceae bacterium]MBQ4104098.1 TetR/AcrR family transcriptional regulator [Clostridia bacterium]